MQKARHHFQQYGFSHSRCLRDVINVAHYLTPKMSLKKQLSTLRLKNFLDITPVAAFPALPIPILPTLESPNFFIAQRRSFHGPDLGKPTWFPFVTMFFHDPSSTALSLLKSRFQCFGFVHVAVFEGALIGSEAGIRGSHVVLFDGRDLVEGSGESGQTVVLLSFVDKVAYFPNGLAGGLAIGCELEVGRPLACCAHGQNGAGGVEDFDGDFF
jgi:hypothetical protein